MYHLEGQRYPSVDQIIGLPNKHDNSLRKGRFKLNDERDGSQAFTSGKGPESLPFKPLVFITFSD